MDDDGWTSDEHAMATGLIHGAVVKGLAVLVEVVAELDDPPIATPDGTGDLGANIIDMHEALMTNEGPSLEIEMMGHTYRITVEEID